MGEEAIPFTSWVLKGQLKAELAIVSASQLSSDSMEVDEDGSRSTAIKQSLLLVTQDKLEGKLRKRFFHVKANII